MSEDELKKIYGLQKLLFLGKMYKEGQDFNKSNNKPLGSYEENLIANGAGSIKAIYPNTSRETVIHYAIDSFLPENIKPEIVLGQIRPSKLR